MDKFYKIAISSGTPLTDDMFMSEELDDTTRETDLIADSWSVGLKKGDYVDLRNYLSLWMTICCPLSYTR